MELRHLRYFVAAAEEQNVTRAAAKLHVSQPGLSRQIHDLEEEIGFNLLARDSRGMRLTEPGRIFLLEARAVLARVEEAMATARALSGNARKQIHIGYAPSLTLEILPPALRLLEMRAPGIRVSLSDLSSREMLAALRDGKLDLALTVEPARADAKGLRFEGLARSQVGLCVARDHPLAGAKEVKIARLVKERLIAYDSSAYPEYLEDLNRLFRRAGVKPRYAEEHDSVNSLITSIAAGRGVALVPRTILGMTGTRVDFIPLLPAPRDLVIGALWRKEKISAAGEQFIAGAREIARGA